MNSLIVSILLLTTACNEVGIFNDVRGVPFCTSCVFILSSSSTKSVINSAPIISITFSGVPTSIMR